jgi:hypothetical protein
LKKNLKIGRAHCTSVFSAGDISAPFIPPGLPALVVMSTPEYLTGNKEAISQFLDKFDVRPCPLSTQDDARSPR